MINYKDKCFKNKNDIIVMHINDYATNVKCPRCRKRHFYIYNFDHLCDRCIKIIMDNFPESEFAPYIEENNRRQNKYLRLSEEKRISYLPYLQESIILNESKDNESNI